MSGGWVGGGGGGVVRIKARKVCKSQKCVRK